MEGPVEINALAIRRGDWASRTAIQQYRVEGQVDSDWTLLSEGTTVGRGKSRPLPRRDRLESSRDDRRIAALRHAALVPLYRSVASECPTSDRRPASAASTRFK